MSPTDKNVFKYRLETEGLEAEIVEKAIALYDEEGKGKGKGIFTIMAPEMYDASGADSVDLELSIEGDIITLTVDEQWLADPERVYPIVIDPSILNTAKAQAALLTVTASSFESGQGYMAAGWIRKGWGGDPDAANWNRGRALLFFDNIFSEYGDEFEIDNAKLKFTQLSDDSNGTETFQVYRLKAASKIEDLREHPGYSNHWDYISPIPREYVGSFPAGIGPKEVDVTELVNNWHKGVYPNYGMLVMSTNDELHGAGPFNGARFYPPRLGETEMLPYIEVVWHEMASVPDDYPLDDITVNTRPIVNADLNGTLDFVGVFWDGISTPHGTVTYELNDSNMYYTQNVPAELEFLYPNSFVFTSVVPSGATKYKRRISNWQTSSILGGLENDKLYYLNAKSILNGEEGISQESDTFIIYKVKQYDLLNNIANYYGVTYDQIAKDNNIGDRLLVEGNTIFIRNPQKNTDTPYTPPDLSDSEKKEIDLLLMGRGYHCEFGFEPINLNTGNFYLNTVDAQVPDLSGNFSLERNYNSFAAAGDSSFGRGWSFEYNERLTTNSEGDMFYRRDDGSVIKFKKNADGSFTAPAGVYLSLEKY